MTCLRATQTRAWKGQSGHNNIDKINVKLCFHVILNFISVRDAKHTNFVEFRNYKIIYRRYAGLYFCICVDVSDNNLFYLEAIHNFVEVRP